MDTRHLTQEEMVAELREKFGDDPMDWAFQCPVCKDVATGLDFRQALTEHPRTRNGEPVTASDLMGQECIGRTLGVLKKGLEPYEGRGCDWCAFGLFRGPWFVTTPEGKEIACFPIAPAPSA